MAPLFVWLQMHSHISSRFVFLEFIGARIHDCAIKVWKCGGENWLAPLRYANSKSLLTIVAAAGPCTYFRSQPSSSLFCSVTSIVNMYWGSWIEVIQWLQKCWIVDILWGGNLSMMFYSSCHECYKSFEVTSRRRVTLRLF